MKRYCKFNGFTLIELLVTISIISLLAAILFPIFARARENARSASCMSNLKQIGLGVMMYTQDYDERYPLCVNDGKYWFEFISPYTSHYSNRTQLYRCPSSWLKLKGGAYSDFSAGNYGANRAVLVDGDGADPIPLSLAAMASPSTAYMIMDAGNLRIRSYDALHPVGNKVFYLPGTGPGSASNLVASGTWSSSSSELEDDFKAGRHFGGINMVFADGHVKWLQSQKVVTEARPCGSGSCFPRFSSSAKSSWNPLVGDS